MATTKDWVGRVSDWVQERFATPPSLETASVFPLTSQYRPDLPPAEKNQVSAKYGPRHDIRDGAKGLGWLGPLPVGDGTVMTEYSMTDRRSGRDFPSINPLLTRREVDYLRTSPQEVPPIPTENRALDEAAFAKARDWARFRRAQGLSPFID